MKFTRYIFVFCLIFAAGCAAGSKVRIDEGYDFSKKVTCAVLPFYCDNPDKKEAAAAVRNIFTANLYEGDIRLIKNTVVDSILAEKGVKIKPFLKDDLVRLGKMLGADIVIYGEITKRERLYAVVHSNITIGARVILFDVNKSKTIFEIEKEEIRNAGLLRVPTGFVAAAAAPIMGLDKYHEDKVISDLGRELAGPINISFNPKKVAGGRAPVIHDVSIAMDRQAADESKIVRVVMIGEEGCSGTFDIENVAQGIPLTYSGDGRFTGSYILPAEVKTVPAKVTFCLVGSGGEKSRRIIERKGSGE